MLQLLQDLRHIKEQMGISTDTISEQSGISRSTIARLWSGDGDPRLQTVIDVANVLKAKLILSTETSRQAFNERSVQPFRELLAEKENTIKAKNEIIQAKEESIQRYEQHIHIIQAREEAHLQQAANERKRVRMLSFIVMAILLAVVLMFALDSGIGHIGWIRY